jgi:hypothetical protein
MNSSCSKDNLILFACGGGGEIERLVLKSSSIE